MKKFGFMRQHRQSKALTMLTMAMLAVALVVGLAFVGCGGGSDYDRTIEELFNQVKNDNKANHLVASINNDYYGYCPDHQQWETQGGHTAATNFNIANATSLSGWYYATSDSVYVASIPRMISILNSFYASKYKTNTAQFNSTSLADGTKLYGWYFFSLRSNGTGSYGGKAGETESPCMVDSYLF